MSMSRFNVLKIVECRRLHKRKFSLNYIANVLIIIFNERFLMNKRTLFLFGLSVFCNALAVENSNSLPTPELSKEYTGIVDAMLKANKSCNGAQLIQKYYQAGQETKGHLIKLLSEALKLMNGDEKRISYEIFSNLYSIAKEAQEIVTLMNEPGRSEYEQNILWRKLVSNSQSKLQNLNGHFCNLIVAAHSHPQYQDIATKNRQNAGAMTNSILKNLVDILDHAKENSKA